VQLKSLENLIGKNFMQDEQSQQCAHRTGKLEVLSSNVHLRRHMMKVNDFRILTKNKIRHFEEQSVYLFQNWSQRRLGK
jgi:hypothetical protein